MAVGGEAPAVRRLGPADAAAYRDIRLEGLREQPAAFAADWHDEAARPLDWFARQLDTGFVLGGGTGKRLDGVVGLDVPDNAKTRHRGLLWGMYVRPEARGRGLARRLIAGVVDHARGRVEELMLGVGVGNHAAIACYRAAGFEVCGLDLRALKVDGVHIDELLMNRRFRAG